MIYLVVPTFTDLSNTFTEILCESFDFFAVNMVHLPQVQFSFSLTFMELQRFLSLIDQIIDGRHSDLHITPDDFPYIRNKVGEIVPVESF